MRFPFLKGHGTLNDFVLLPDLDGSLHGNLAPGMVVALCDRRAGIGADGVLRVIRAQPDAPWFMDYRNADGSVAQMCGNGVRVFARYLEEAGLVDPALPLEVDTRDGLKRVTFCDDGEISVDMGVPVVGSVVKVAVEGREYAARAVDVGNPHAVAVVESLTDAGELRLPPAFSVTDFPDGVNVEFVVRHSKTDLSMRVYERGVGETASCGTGAVAVVAAVAAHEATAQEAEASPDPYHVRVPGGLLTATQDAGHHVHLKGPAVLVAQGTWTG